MTQTQSKIKKSPSSLSVRSIGIGEIERVSTADLSSPTANHVVVGNEEESSFVVRNFRALKSKWLHHDKPMDEKGLIENDTVAIRTDSSSMSEGASEDTVPYDLTTDLAYHNSSEREGADLIYRALTPEEQSAMPDSFMPLRHYRAEKGDVTKATNAIKHTLKWRKEFQVDRLVSALGDDSTNKNDKRNKNEQDEDFAAILRKENETGKIYVRGYDKDGRSMMYMRPGNENTMDENNNMRHLVFQIEKAIACSQKNGHGKICLVIDYEGFSITKTPSMSASKSTLTILQQHFCERMHRAYICNPPFVFRSFYAMIKPFVDPVTRQKVCWCVGRKGLDQVINDVGGIEKAAKQLERCFGGVETLRDFNSVEYNQLPLSIAFDENVNY